jgi:hypothetical protein
MSAQPWGKPRWNGKKVNVDLNKALLPVVNNEAFCIQIEGCENFFMLLFSAEADLRAVMAQLQKKIGFGGYAIKVVTDPEDFMRSIMELGLRIMLNPQIINDHHTKWLEVIRDGDEIFYFDAEVN